MKRALVSSVLLVPFAIACGSSPPPDATAPAESKVSAAVSAEPTTAPVPEAAKPAELSPEEKKKEEAKLALEADRAKWKAEHEKELARFTPEIKAAVKALAEKTHASGKVAVQAALASKHRKPTNAERDGQRHPVETLELFGFKPNLSVLEVGPGEGWYVEVLAPALAKSGKLFITNGDANGPVGERSTFYAQRAKSFLDGLPEAYGKVDTITVDGKAPKLPHEGKMDMVLVMRGLHGWVNAKSWDAWITEVHETLKPNGVLGIEEHRAKADAVPEESAKMGYLPEKWVIEKIEAAGFKLAAKSEVNANPKDTKDHPEGVWTLPPSFRLGDKDRAKYAGIGESDRMTLKFVKVAKKAAGVKETAKPAEGQKDAAGNVLKK
jgi:predicted methyltransferase